jgi:AAA15 family ATPase/GTPase
MIKSIEIRKFRLFSDIKFNLGKNITVIAGCNASGKSTLLAMIGNSCELKSNLGRPLLFNQFRTEFSEIIKGSKFDKLPRGQASKLFKVNFCNEDFTNSKDYRYFRITWQEEGTRFHLVPSNVEKKTETKVTWPTLYLGLSRLFPIGESNDEGLKSETITQIGDEDIAWLKESYKQILSMNYDEIKDIKSIKIKETERKRGVGISTDKFDLFVNSAGQDNIGQLLCAVFSFKMLKSNMQDMMVVYC